MATSLPTLFSFLAVFFLCICVSARATDNGFGDRLLRTFLLFKDQPLTALDALDQGWVAVNGTTCVPNRGIVYAKSSSGPSSFSPTILYYTPKGQISAFGVRVWGDMSDTLIGAGLVVPAESGAYDIFLTTRNPSSICSSQTYQEVLGDQVHVGGVFPVPLSESVAQSDGWVMGNCIGRMGIHYSFDLASPGNQTWNASSQVPVLPMYDAKRHTINAILINVWNWQKTEPLGVFEGPFIPYLYCLNWCADSGCNWPQVSLWTTLHWHFVDPASISCDGAPCAL